MKQLFASLLLLAVSYSAFASAGLFELVEEHFILSTSHQQRPNSLVDTNSPQDVWGIFLQTQQHLQQDIVTDLALGDRAATLRTYLLRSEYLLQALEYQENSLNNRYILLSNQQLQCNHQLDQANNLYSSSLEHFQGTQFSAAIEQAKKARSCLGEVSVELKALDTLLLKKRQYSSLLTTRSSYLKKNQQLILEHYDILKPELLAELYNISLRLESNRFL